MLTMILALTLVGQHPRLTLDGGAYPTALGFSPDGKAIAANSGGRTVTLWDATSGKELAKLDGHLGRVTSLAFGLDGKALFIGSSRSIDDNEWLAAVRAGKEPPSTVAEVVAWDVPARKRLWRRQHEQYNGICLALSPDGKTLATTWGLNSEWIRLWDPFTGKELYTFAEYDSGDAVRSLAFSPDGSTLAAGAISGVRLLDLATRKERTYLPGYLTYFHQVAYSRDGKTILYVDSPGRDTERLVLREAATGGLVRMVKDAHHWGVSSVPGKDVMAVTRHGGRVLFLEAKTGKELAGLQAHSESALAVAFSPDGKRMVTVGVDRPRTNKPYGHLKVWDVPELP